MLAAIPTFAWMNSVFKGFMRLMWVMFVVGCQPQEEPLRIVSSLWPGYEPLYLARYLGYFPADIFKLIELPSSNITMEAFSNRSADVASLTLDETLTLLAQGRKPRILLIMDVSNGADAVMADASIRSLADLKGKRIAIVNIPLGVYMLTRTLDAAGLKVSDVTVLTLPEDMHEKAYREGKIDVSINFEPFKSRLAEQGMHVLFDSSKIPNEIFDVLVAQDEIYSTRREALCNLVQQWNRTLDYIGTHSSEAHARMGKRLAMDAKAYESMLAGIVLPTLQQNRQFLGGTSPALLAPAEKLAQIMFQARLLPIAVNPSDALAPEFQDCQQQ